MRLRDIKMCLCGSVEKRFFLRTTDMTPHHKKLGRFLSR
jgi:hypothetical protein